MDPCTDDSSDEEPVVHSSNFVLPGQMCRAVAIDMRTYANGHPDDNESCRFGAYCPGTNGA